MKFGNQMYSLKEQIMRNRHRKSYYTFFIIMVVVVFFYTVYSLIVPAVTLDESQETLKCSLNVHQHTAECRDEDSTLICGMAEFVIHTHNEKCYNTDGRLVCNLPEKAAHEHTDECYEEQQILICTNDEEGHTHEDSCYQTEKKLICEETAILHTHDDTCYDENGTLICGMIQLTEHNHGTECFPAAEETATTDTTNDVMTETTTTNDGTTYTAATTAITSDVTTSTADMANEIMLAAETASEETWGYNDDGSIWWSDKAILEKFNSDSIKKNTDTPYIIAGNNGINVLTNTSKNETEMSTSHPSTNIAYKDYEIWCFEKAGATDNEYYIRDVDGNYIKMENAEDTKSATVSLTGKADASVFIVENSTENANCVMLKAKNCSKYINISGGDEYCDQNGNKWSGWYQPGGGSYLQILKVTSQRQTSQKVETVSSPNTVINLFDYWITENQNDCDSPSKVNPNLNGGINKEHPFKFTHGAKDKSGGIINEWTGNKEMPRQGIVQNTLVNRYPVLSENPYESLAYLFDPTVEHEGKQSFTKVGGLWTISDGYYYFDSSERAAEFDADKNTINVYDQSLSNDQFFPFNKTPEVMDLDRVDEKINHYFGATITTRFVQDNDGYTDFNKINATTFEFSGDDDVWIFIDDVLVGDLGGIHDKANVTINFATGEVNICVAANESNCVNTTLKKCYEAADADDSTKWQDIGNGNYIYKNNTIHTLKFFYLERGNYDSNMKLKYNLITVPQTAIYKVNQYGEKVPGATFAVYAADSQYNMLSVNGGIVEPTESIEYDENGDIMSNGTVIAKALYTGTTDKNGEMVFLDDDNMPYSINELHEMFGDHFILREIKVPEGYRVVSKDVHLQIWNGENQKILKCNNTNQSGSRAASNMQITATDTLHLYREYKNSHSVKYCDENGTPTGTLFAVVYKRVNKTTDVNDSSNWVPVYGNDKEGYIIVDMKDKSQLEAALVAAKKANEIENNNICFKHTNTGTMQLTLKNLPGHITTYYHLLANDQKDQAQYTVAYYWTEETLDKANTENTFRVDSTANGQSYSGFKLVYGADIHVPNLINKVFVQKVDEAGGKKELINGATFAIYKVEEQNSKIMYLANDKQYHSLSGEESIDPESGVITGQGFTIKPVNIGTTETYADGIHKGTTEFKNLSEGQYIIKEVKAPPGYKLNTADVMVLVTEDTIYANAGTKNDGIAVGRGPGYLVTPLNQYASQGQIDNTLTWIYAQMKITGESKSFTDARNASKYITKNYTGETDADVNKAFKTYLKYAAENEGMAFNYVQNPERNNGTDSDGYRRIFTTVGWSYYEIRQDHEYGEKKANGANYEDWRNLELTHLFSRSTYIRVTDKQEPTLKVKKVDAANKDTELAGAKFRLYMKKTENDEEVKLYYWWNSDKNTVEWPKNENEALVVETQNNGMANIDFTSLPDGEYFLEEVEPPKGYCKLSKPLEFTLNEKGVTPHIEIQSSEKIADFSEPVGDDPPTYTVTVYNYPSFVLPATGGGGTAPYTIGGILFMAVPLMYVCGKKLRSKRSMK